MARIAGTSADLRRFSEAVLTLHECRSSADLGATFLRAMGALCDADCRAVNSIGSSELGIFSSTMDFTREHMEVFNAHLREHPLVGLIDEGRESNRPVAGRWSDRTTLREFRQRALYHDFFRVVDVQHQVAAVVRVNRRLALGFSLNRSRKDFRPEDTQMLQLLLPHFRQLTQRMIVQAEADEALALHNLAIGDEAVMVVDLQARPLFTTERARQLVRDYFSAGAKEELPPELRSWLLSNPSTEDRLTRDQPGRRLVCTCGVLAPWRRNGVPGSAVQDRVPAFVRCVRFAEHDESKGERALQTLGLTQREAQVLFWMAQGKRNGEMATFLKMSPRTVDKHAEHIFAKLGVETRAAAVALAVETLR